MMDETDMDAVVGWPQLRDKPPDAQLLALLSSRSLGSLSVAELVDMCAAAKRLTIAREAVGLAAGERIWPSWTSVRSLRSGSHRAGRMRD